MNTSDNYTEIISAHLQSLWFTALRLTKNREDAEDIVQETCIKAFENMNSLRSKNKAKSWLLKILTNTFINKYRKEQRRPEELDMDADFLEPIFYKDGKYIDMERDIFSGIMDEDVASALENLPFEFRIAIILIDIEEVSYREAEEILKISPGTLASRLYRGRRLLRDSLAEYAKSKGYLRGEGNGL